VDPLLAFGFWAFVLTFAGIYAIFVLGLQLEVGDAGLVNFGHVGFFAIGAYAAGLMLREGVPIPLAVLGAVAAGAAAGILLGLPTLRLRADYFAITTIAAGEIVRIVVENEPGTTGGTNGLRGASGGWPGFSRDVLDALAGIGLDVDRRVPLLALVWISAALLVGLLAWLGRTPWRRALRAVREDEDAAAAVGKPVLVYKLQAMAIGSGIAALAGVYWAFLSTTIYPENFEPIVTFIGFGILILGGMGSYLGTAIGAVVIGFIVAGTRFLDFPLAADKVASLRYVAIGLIIMLVMIFRPQGLLGKKEELHLDA
jgi:branched-chain amino acid transport system permease protein